MNLPGFIIPIRSLFVNAYLLHDGNHLVLIDCGLPGIITHMRKRVGSINHKLSDLTTIIITHADGDHYGGLPELQDACSAEVCTSQLEADAIRNGTSSRALTPRGPEVLVYKAIGLLFKHQPARVDRILSEGEILPILGGLKVISTPGHTPGHLSLYLLNERILFSGDSIITGTHLKASNGANTWNGQIAWKSFENQMSLKPKWILAGHGIKQIDN